MQNEGFEMLDADQGRASDAMQKERRRSVRVRREIVRVGRETPRDARLYLFACLEFRQIHHGGAC